MLRRNRSMNPESSMQHAACRALGCTLKRYELYVHIERVMHTTSKTSGLSLGRQGRISTSKKHSKIPRNFDGLAGLATLSTFSVVYLKQRRFDVDRLPNTRF